MSKLINNIKSYHVSQCKVIGTCFNMHMSCLLGDFCYMNIFFLFAIHFCFYGRCYMMHKELFSSRIFCFVLEICLFLVVALLDF